MKTALLAASYNQANGEAFAIMLSQAGYLAPLGALPYLHMAPGTLAASYSFPPAVMTPEGHVQPGVLAAVATDMAGLFAELGAPAGAKSSLRSVNVQFHDAHAKEALYVSPSGRPIDWTRDGDQLVTLQGRSGGAGDLVFTVTMLVDVVPAGWA